MKKVIIFLFVLCLSGCVVTNADFEKTCTIVNKSSDLKDSMQIYVTYDNEDVVKKAIVTKTYESLTEEGVSLLEDIKKSGVSFNEKYADNENIKITVSKDEDNIWELKYYLDVPNLKSDILDEFMLKQNSIKFFNKMKDENIECK